MYFNSIIAVAVYYQNRADEIKAAKGYVVEDDIHASIMADLQQKQDQEFYILIKGLPNKVECRTMKQTVEKRKKC